MPCFLEVFRTHFALEALKELGPPRAAPAAERASREASLAIAVF